MNDQSRFAVHYKSGEKITTVDKWSEELTVAKIMIEEFIESGNLEDHGNYFKVIVSNGEAAYRKVKEDEITFECELIAATYTDQQSFIERFLKDA